MEKEEYEEYKELQGIEGFGRGKWAGMGIIGSAESGYFSGRESEEVAKDGKRLKRSGKARWAISKLRET